MIAGATILGVCWFSARWTPLHRRTFVWGAAVMLLVAAAAGMMLADAAPALVRAAVSR